ncbi:MAG TPA: hypothetical protein VK604_06465 [Bryobacteraceae bacterium]|nr:hypothetical protein [Bryobacteraceae bacterium]
MLVLFVAVVQFLAHGASTLTIPFNVLLTSVLVFIFISPLAGVLLRTLLLRRHGRASFEGVLLPKFAPVASVALHGTLVRIFAFHADNSTGRFFTYYSLGVMLALDMRSGCITVSTMNGLPYSGASAMSFEAI